MYPYEEKIWRQVKSPLFWFLTVFSLIPFVAIQLVHFIFFEFLMIDKTDEYQVIAFIVRFKRFFFLSFGVVKGIISYVQYYICVNFQKEEDGLIHSCNVRGSPGFSTYFWLELGSFVIQFILVWIAFWYLQYAKPKG